MILELNFELKKSEIPLNYRKTIMSFIKETFKNTNKDLYDKYYTNNLNKKTFTFSISTNGLKFNSNRFLLNDNNLKVFISTQDISIYYILFNVFINSLNTKYPLSLDNSMILKNVIEKKSIKITTEKILCKTLAPICIEEHIHDNRSTKYLSVKNETELVNHIEKIYGVKMVPKDMKMVIVRHQVGNNNNNKIELKFETSLGIFELIGDINKLQKLYDNGFGNRTGEGFGMFTILEKGGIIN